MHIHVLLKVRAVIISFIERSREWRSAPGAISGAGLLGEQKAPPPPGGGSGAWCVVARSAISDLESVGRSTDNVL